MFEVMTNTIPKLKKLKWFIEEIFFAIQKNCFPKLRNLYTITIDLEYLTGSLFMPYLNAGIGKAWAWQSNPKLWPIDFTNQLLLESPENVGAFAPTGSMRLN
jgi:hypothetical protein